MGADNSSSSNSDNCLYDEKDISDYYGLKTNFSEKEESSDNCSKFNYPTQKSIKIKEESNEKSDSIPTTFEWNNGGNNVYVTGSFCNWNQFFLMKKNQQGSFILTINLPRGNHEYKFKVDNQWRFNEKYPTCNNSGNINNYLDTTKWEITVINTDEGTTVPSSNATTDNEQSNKNLEKDACKLIMKRYSNYIPSKEIFSEKIPDSPDNYKMNENINLLSNQKYIGNKNFLTISDLSGEIDYKNIKTVHHEQINHLLSSNDKKQSKKNILCSITTRYRHKYTTFVYYKSKNSK